MNGENARNVEILKPLIVTDLREITSEESFSSIQDQLEGGGQVFVRTIDNSIYNKGMLRASQKAIRQKAADEALEDKGHPATPVGKLVRFKSESGVDPRVWMIVLNGHHRTGRRLIDRKGINLEILLASDDVTSREEVAYGLDFEDSKVMDEYGLKTNPKLVALGYGFNVIVRKLRSYYLSGDIEFTRSADPVNNIPRPYLSGYENDR